MKRVLGRSLVTLAITACVLGCGRHRTGELVPPNDAPAWEIGLSRPFDDGYTRTPIQLQGRAPNDVLDQDLFAQRLGLASIVALSTVHQVWGRGRFQSKQDQFIEVEIEETLIGKLPKGALSRQTLRVRSEDGLPGGLQGRRMILFVRWAPGDVPPYHHHLMPADETLLAYIRALIKHAQDEGVLDEEGMPGSGRKKRRTSTGE